MKVAISRADGGVSIMYVIEGDVSTEIEKWRASFPGQYQSHREIQTVPADRTFRNAWKPDLTPDVKKAIEIQKAIVRTRALAEQRQNELNAVPTGRLDSAKTIEDVLRGP